MSLPPRRSRLLPRSGPLLALALTLVACSDHGRSVAAEPAEPDGSRRTQAAPASAPLPNVHLVPAHPGLSFARPVQLVHAGDGTNRAFVVEQAGRVRVFDHARETKQSKVFLDIKERVRMRHNEEGLLSLAFHPKFTDNRAFYVYYTASKPRRGVLSRFRVSSDDPDRADAAAEEVILEVEQPYGNHNGGTVVFGPDGYLYLSLGDGGYANDPHGHGQDLSTLLGTVLRLDVDNTEAGRAYAIPKDNPFVDRPGARGEIWAYGLRNVWRMSFDRETSLLWAGDVGQNKFEEIDVIVRGGNYGWNIREGLHEFRGGSSSDPLLDPVAEYPRSDGISVTGGAVYRGTKHPKLVGVYLYADYVTGAIWGLRYEHGAVTANRIVKKARRGRHITSFDEGPDGELYVCAFDRVDGRKGKVFRVVSE